MRTHKNVFMPAVKQSSGLLPISHSFTHSLQQRHVRVTRFSGRNQAPMCSHSEETEWTETSPERNKQRYASPKKSNFYVILQFVLSVMSLWFLSAAVCSSSLKLKPRQLWRTAEVCCSVILPVNRRRVFFMPALLWFTIHVALCVTSIYWPWSFYLKVV